jgi:hypothetical protein
MRGIMTGIMMAVREAQAGKCCAGGPGQEAGASVLLPDSAAVRRRWTVTESG